MSRIATPLPFHLKLPTLISTRCGSSYVFALLAGLPFSSAAQEWNKSSPPATISSTTEEQTKPQVKLRLGIDYPLRTNENGDVGAGTQGEPAVSPTFQAEFRVEPVSYWFGSIAFYRYLYGDRQRPWNPDFTYTFGYDDWHPDTISLVYGNYAGNRLRPASSETHAHFSEGTWSLGYKFRMPKALDPIFKADEKHEVICIVNAHVTPRYTTLQDTSLQKYKRALSLGCRYMLPSNLYANLTVFYYPDHSQQQPWDPDFTYSFGYFDWRPGTISVQYNNYSGNRFAWRNGNDGQGGFRAGSVSVFWSQSW